MSYQQSTRPSHLGRLLEDERSLSESLASESSSEQPASSKESADADVVNNVPDAPQQISHGVWKLDLSTITAQARDHDPQRLASRKPAVANLSVYKSLWQAFTSKVEQGKLKDAQETLAQLDVMLAYFKDRAETLKATMDRLLRKQGADLELPKQDCDAYDQAAKACIDAYNTWAVDEMERQLALMNELISRSNRNEGTRVAVDVDIDRYQDSLSKLKKERTDDVSVAAIEKCMECMRLIERLKLEKRWDEAKQQLESLSNLVVEVTYPPTRNAEEEHSSDSDEEPDSDNEANEGSEQDNDEEDDEGERSATQLLNASLEKSKGANPCLTIDAPVLRHRGEIEEFRKNLAKAFAKECTRLPSAKGVQIGDISFVCSKPAVAAQGPKLGPERNLSRAAKAVGQEGQDGSQVAGGMFTFHAGVTLNTGSGADADGWQVRVVQNCMSSSREVTYSDKSRMFIKVGFACKDVDGENQTLVPGKTAMLTLSDAPSWRWVHKNGAKVQSVAVSDQFRVFVLVTSPKNQVHCLMYLDWTFVANASGGAYKVTGVTECDGTSDCAVVLAGTEMNLMGEVFQRGSDAQ